MKVALTLSFLSASLSGNEIQIESVVVYPLDAVNVPAHDEGVLTKINVELGDTINEQESLACLDDRQQRLQVDAAKIELQIAERLAESELARQAAEKELALAKVELDRLLRTKERFDEAVTQSEIDRKTLIVDQTEIKLMQAREDQQIASLTVKLKRNALSVAENTLMNRTLRAPFSGKVTEINLRQGDWVRPGDIVLRLIRIDRLLVEGYVMAEQLKKDLTGVQVTLTIDIPGQLGADYKGKIIFVDPEFDPFNNRTSFRALIENHDGKLFPGLKGRLSIHP